MQIIDCKTRANQIVDQVKLKTAEFEMSPLLHIVAATKDESALKYAELKKKKCEEIGLRCQVIKHSEDETIEGLIEGIEQITETGHLTGSFSYGVMVQLPLYSQLEAGRRQILDAIPPHHDVDGLTSTNLGLTMTGGDQAVLPATVAAILEALTIRAEQESTTLAEFVKSKQVVIVNHSNLIGKPLAVSLLNLDATVTVAHKYTKNLTEPTKTADILITAAGTPGLLTVANIKDGATVIDVTSISTPEGVVGDVLRDADLEAKPGWITSVPGGVGPLTVACLLRNLVRLPKVNSL
jgi:methylenetetrahydrofolate dehydrogenase (NADP+)/methenyltetrahydrofolate cyclohydrolase